jgi:hypothetical protein
MPYRAASSTTCRAAPSIAASTKAPRFHYFDLETGVRLDTVGQLV